MKSKITSLKSVARTRSKAEMRKEAKARIIKAAEKVFAEKGFDGARTAQIAEVAKVPKANLHYYFPKKADLYRRVIEDICNAWLDATDAFDSNASPREVIEGYIRAKMRLSKDRKYGSKIWANEIVSGGHEVQLYISSTVKKWLNDLEKKFDLWKSEGKIADIDPRTFIYMLWATTQHYADFETQITILNDGEPLGDAQYEKVTDDVVELLLRSLNLN